MKNVFDRSFIRIVTVIASLGLIVEACGGCCPACPPAQNVVIARSFALVLQALALARDERPASAAAFASALAAASARS